MNLSMTAELATAYKSGSQKAGNVTEAWGADNFYCPNCSSPKLDWLKPGTKANDYQCPSCKFWFQLKSQKTRIARTITDGAYQAMMDAIREDRSPNFYFLHYDLATWSVRNLLLIPHFAFPPSAIIKRKPLSTTARRAGWIGCNFDLTRIPVESRIALVQTVPSRIEPLNQQRKILPERGNPFSLSPGERAGVRADFIATGVDGNQSIRTLIIPPEEVRKKFQRIKPLKEISIKERGWTLDVLNLVHRLGKIEFTNAEIYAHAHAPSKNSTPTTATAATNFASNGKSFATPDYWCTRRAECGAFHRVS